MSIGYRKISEMIIEEVEGIDKMESQQKKIVAELCKKIYMLNANLDSVTGAHMNESIKGEISLAADNLKEHGVEL